MKKLAFWGEVVFFCLFVFLAGYASAYQIDGGLSALLEGAPPSNVPDYQWWYGCSPTAAGMMMAYYDIYGYNGLRYDNLVPGGLAELSTYPSTPGQWEYLAQDIIASPGHVNDFYRSGYGASGDDLPYPTHTFDSLADFMGTSQDAVGNPNGGTTFFFRTDGLPLYVADVYQIGPSFYDKSGMFGIWEYVDYRGYGSHDPANDHYIFNQYVDTYLQNNYGISGGFTFDDYKAEIDAGRVVILHLTGHSMLGYGYDAATQTIYFHDTWTEGQHSMPWGGSYGGMALAGVTVFIPTGGSSPVPEPCTVLLLGSGIGIVLWRKRGKHNLAS